MNVGEVRAKVMLLDTRGPLELDALVDTGAVISLIGRDIADFLELSIIRQGVFEMADGRKITLPIVGPLHVSILGREAYIEVAVAEPSTEPLIGQLVLEALDLIVDAPRKRLRTRPESPTLPSYKLK